MSKVKIRFSVFIIIFSVSEVFAGTPDEVVHTGIESLFDRLEQSETTQTYAAQTDGIDRLPPRCNEWTNHQLYTALIAGSSEEMSFRNYMKAAYDVWISGDDRFTKFFAVVEPTSDERTKNSWINFVDGYVNYKATQPELMKSRTANKYCRMKKLQGIDAILSDRHADKSMKQTILQLIPFLAERERWALFERLVINTNDEDILMDTIELLLRNYTGVDPAGILEKIHKSTNNNTVRLAVLEAYKTLDVDENCPQCPTVISVY